MFCLMPWTQTFVMLIVIFPLLMSPSVAISSSSTGEAHTVVPPFPPSMNCLRGECGWTLRYTSPCSHRKRKEEAVRNEEDFIKTTFKTLSSSFCVL